MVREGFFMMKDILYEKVEQRLIEKELGLDKSARLAEWCAADHAGSLRNDTETLFLNEKGEYIIVYEGGMGAGFHGLPGVETWFGGSYVRTLSLEDAYTWCEETGNFDAIRDHLPFYLISMAGKAPE
jgi:hypothetical protein